MISRRQFLIGTGGIAGALALWIFWPESPKLPLGQSNEADTDFVGVWIHIDEQNQVKFLSPSSEIGQGIFTGFAQIVAQFLDIPLQNISVEPAPANERLYGNPKSMNMQITGGSASIVGFYEPLKMAMSQARTMLLTAAAQQWKTDVKSLNTESGYVVSSNGSRKSYGELVKAASRLDIPQKPLVKNGENFVGQSQARIDLLDKINGQAIYGIDVKLPDLLIGSIRHYPYFAHDKIPATNLKDIRAMAGVQEVIETGRGIVVLAKTTWHAIQACKAVEFAKDSEVKQSKINDESINAKLIAALDGEGKGNPQGERIHEAEYHFPYLAHQTLEPQNCTVWAKPDKTVEIWIATQGQGQVAKAIKNVAGISFDQIKVHTTLAGGGFGRRGESDMVEPALTASMKTGKPVKLTWSREEDTQNDFYRSATKARVQISLDKQGNPLQWYQQFSTTSILARFVGSTLEWIDWDPVTVEGASEIPYATQKYQYDVGLIEGDVPVGFWRSVAHTYTAFVLETAIDSLAHLANKDPWQYRFDLLVEQPRFVRVMEKLKQISHWGDPLPSGMAHGMAIHKSFGSIVGEVLLVSNDNNMPRVHKAYAVVDCGIAVNPELIKQQVEGGMIMGLSAAMGEKINIDQGRVMQTNFHDYPILRNAMAPRSIEVAVIAEGDEIGGVGEVGVPPAAPALANAWWVLTGNRITSLPFSTKTGDRLRHAD